jgi:hypothetical protein
MLDRGEDIVEIGLSCVDGLLASAEAENNLVRLGQMTDCDSLLLDIIECLVSLVSLVSYE